jgi:hypothetical protein
MLTEAESKWAVYCNGMFIGPHPGGSFGTRRHSSPLSILLAGFHLRAVSTTPSAAFVGATSLRRGRDDVPVTSISVDTSSVYRDDRDRKVLRIEHPPWARVAVCISLRRLGSTTLEALKQPATTTVASLGNVAQYSGQAQAAGREARAKDRWRWSEPVGILTAWSASWMRSFRVEN